MPATYSLKRWPSNVFEISLFMIYKNPTSGRYVMGIITGLNATCESTQRQFPLRYRETYFLMTVMIWLLWRVMLRLAIWPFIAQTYRLLLLSPSIFIPQSGLTAESFKECYVLEALLVCYFLNVSLVYFRVVFIGFCFSIWVTEMDTKEKAIKNRKR